VQTGRPVIVKQAAPLARRADPQPSLPLEIHRRRDRLQRVDGNDRLATPDTSDRPRWLTWQNTIQLGERDSRLRRQIKQPHGYRLGALLFAEPAGEIR
jgi:hypothetical protein